MRIEKLELFSYQLKLKRPLILKSESLFTRSGYLVKISDGRGRCSITDIAPLPHFSQEGLEDILPFFLELKEELLQSFWSLKLLLSPRNILNNNQSLHQYPSLFFGLEFALLSLMMPKFSLFKEVKINLLLMGSDEDILEKVRKAPEYEAIKLKTGPRSPDQVLELIEELRPYLLSHQTLRIDTNRSWSLKETLYFCEHFPIELCDYLEEPLQNPQEYLTLASYTPHPIAFDESLQECPLDFLLAIPTKKAFVIKPSLIGSLQKMNQLYQKACRHQLKFVLTSSFESGLGHLMIAHLSRFLGIEVPIGLDTYSWFQEDVLATPLKLHQGKLLLPKENLIKPDLNEMLVTQIDV